MRLRPGEDEFVLPKNLTPASSTSTNLDNLLRKHRHRGSLVVTGFLTDQCIAIRV